MEPAKVKKHTRFSKYFWNCRNLILNIKCVECCSTKSLLLAKFSFVLQFQFISEILRRRSQSTPDHIVFTLLNSKGAVAKVLSCSELHKRADRIGNLLNEKGRINTGDHVALIFPPGLDLICAFYGCLYVGAVPVTIRPPHPQNLQTTLPTVRMIVDVSKSVLVLSSQPVIKLLRSKEASNVVSSFKFN